MNRHEGGKRCYIRSSKAWYNNVVEEIEIMVGIYYDEGGTSGEFRFRWTEIGNKLVPKLVCYDDSWNALSLFRDLLDKMAEIDDENITEPEFSKILDELGIFDKTEYEQYDYQSNYCSTNNPILK